VKLAVGWLDRVLGEPQDPLQRRQSLADLKSILQGGKPPQIVNWVKAYYR
jgi:hypothetical protein